MVKTRGIGLGVISAPQGRGKPSLNRDRNFPRPSGTLIQPRQIPGLAPFANMRHPSGASFTVKRKIRFYPLKS